MITCLINVFGCIFNCVIITFKANPKMSTAVSILQAKNEPAGKKPADKTDLKKPGSEMRRSTDSK